MLISGHAFWNQIIDIIQICQFLNVKQPVMGIYSTLDGVKSYEKDWLGFKAGTSYYVETEDDPKFTMRN
jgi:hypothetical protein